MSEVETKFLQQLGTDLQDLFEESCPISRRLRELFPKLDIVDSGRPEAISWDAEQRRFLIESSHPAVKKVLSSRIRRRSDVVFFLSMLATLLNRLDSEIHDEHERAFHARLLRHALQHGQGSWST